MTTQNFIDMYGLLLGENAGPVKKMMMVHAAYWALRCSNNATVIPLLHEFGFTSEEINAGKQIIWKESEKKLFDL